MTRLHYASRPNSRPGRAYRGVPRRQPEPAPPLVPVTEGLAECPVCGSGVKLVGAPFSFDGVVQGVTRVIGSHRSRSGKCAGTHQLPK